MLFNEYIAVCGTNCKKCEAYKATRSKSNRKLKKVAEEWSELLFFSLDIEDIKCNGCRVQEGKKASFVTMCDIRNCSIEKRVHTCAHCQQSTCSKIKSQPIIENINKLKKELSL